MSERPTGRDEIHRAVLVAAIQLFAERGPEAVSLRDIAAAAKVNLGLLHRHFGSKSELVQAALRQVVERHGAERAVAFAGPDLVERMAGFTTEPSQAYVRMIAWSLLHGADPSTLQVAHPGASALVQRFCDEGRDEHDARLAAAGLLALTLGWSLFEPFVRVATGLDADGEDLRSDVAELIGRVVTQR